MLRVNIKDPNLTLDPKPTNWGAAINLYNGLRFTGIIEEYFEGTSQLLYEGEHRDGIVHRRQVEYFSNGQIRFETFERYDGFYGTRKRWNEQGVLIYEESFSEEGTSIWAKRYNNQGVLTEHWLGNNKVL